MVSVDDFDEAAPPVDAHQIVNRHVIINNNISNDVIVAVTHFLRQQGYHAIPSFEDFCWTTIRDHIRAQRDEEDGMGYIYDAVDLIMSSSDYAITCEALGFIVNPDMIEYTAGRGGTMIYLDEHNWIDDHIPHNIHECNFINFRDVIQVLRIIGG